MVMNQRIQNYIEKLPPSYQEEVVDFLAYLLAKAERERLKKLHLMRCPKCGMELINIDYRGIEVDKCSECQGIWLDAGEFEAGYNLDRNIIEKLFAVFKK